MAEKVERKPRKKATKQKSLQLTPKAIEVLNQLTRETGFDQGTVVSLLVTGWGDSFLNKHRA